jgi:hypothetical protein
MQWRIISPHSSLTDGPRRTGPHIVDPLKLQSFPTFGPYFLLQKAPWAFRDRHIWIVETFCTYFWQPQKAFLEGWAGGVDR